MVTNPDCLVRSKKLILPVYWKDKARLSSVNLTHVLSIQCWKALRMTCCS